MSARRYGNRAILNSLERFTGRYYHDKPLFEITISVGALPNAGTTIIAHGLSIDEVHHLFGIAEDSTGLIIPIPG